MAEKACKQCGSKLPYTGDRVRMVAKMFGGNGSWAADLCNVCFDKEMEEIQK